LYSEGDLAGAIHAYELALIHAPDDAFLGGRVDAWRREAELHQRFAQRFGDHFTILFEGPREEEVAARAIALLEATYWRIGTALGAYPNGIVTVVLYTNEQFRDITQSPSWAVAAFDGRIRVPMRGAFDSPGELERVLAHEFTHALVRSLAPRGVPQWLNEGLAQYFEPGARGNARDVPATTSGGHDPGRGLIPLARLEDTFDGLDARQARLAYTQSALAAHALVDLAGLTGVLNLLSYVGQGMPFSEAFERATFVSYAEFDRTWAER
ncbi:MAG TPA: hypothetical protein VLD67_18370, partial [Vicinamibacterales bacterium]|nr:hypothetical protein [Vicinamibacterales bacterium]